MRVRVPGLSAELQERAGLTDRQAEALSLRRSRSNVEQRAEQMAQERVSTLKAEHGLPM